MMSTINDGANVVKYLFRPSVVLIKGKDEIDSLFFAKRRFCTYFGITLTLIEALELLRIHFDMKKTGLKYQLNFFDQVFEHFFN